MLETGQHWQLFGYDMRRAGKQWLAAWNSLLWAEGSPLRERLDEVVCLHDGQRSDLYQSGRLASDTEFECEAVLLPEELFLSRTLKLPVAVEEDLLAALSIEVNASSPFSSDDTAYGWRILERNESHLHLVMVISSMSAVMTFLGHDYDLHDPHLREIWADVNGTMVVLRGFGEAKREKKYRKRLLRCSLLVAFCLSLVLMMAGMAAATKRAELAQMDKLAVSTQRKAAEASRYRSVLARGNESIRAANTLIAKYPNPHFELARLTRLLGDEAYIAQFRMNGREIKLRGRALDASSVMQVLTGEPMYQEVTAPQAIVKVGKSGLEQFSLNITLAREINQ